MTTCLSPNGQNVYPETKPCTRLFVGTIGGINVLERQDSTSPWRVTGTQLAESHISSLMIDPKRGGVFAGTHRGGGIYRSLDGGQTWEQKANGLSIEHVYSVRSAEVDGNVVIYAGTEPASLFRSDDYGETWRELPALKSVANTDKWMFPAPPHLPHTKSIAVDPRNTSVIYAGVEQGALLKSTDGGETWRELDAYSREDDYAYKDIHQLTLRPSNPNEMYMTTGPGLYYSPDQGETWEQLTGKGFRLGYPDQLLYSPLDDRVMFMSGSEENPGVWLKKHHSSATVVRTRDGGRSWEEANRGMPESMHGNLEAMALSIEPDGFTLFAGNTDGEVYASYDGADTWTRIASDLPAVSKSIHVHMLKERVGAEAHSH